MDLNSSPSLSPNNTVFSARPYFDSTSDSSTPHSPHTNQLLFTSSMPYEMYGYSAALANFYPAQGSDTIPIELMPHSLGEKGSRRKRSDSFKSDEKEVSPNMHLRRRAQNRASQRAFRERKDKHVKGLEHQLEELHEKHQDLVQSFTKQADEVSRLNKRIAELSGELNATRHYSESPFDELIIPDKFDRFDAFSASDIVYNAGDTRYGKGPIDLDSESTLHSFEDLL